MSSGFDPDQARPFVGPDLGPNCLQRSSADGKIVISRQRVKLIDAGLSYKDITFGVDKE